MIRQRRRKVAALAVAGCGAMLALAACGSSAGSSSANTLTKVSLRMPWHMSGYMAPFNLAKTAGYYEAEGLDVTIGEGKGSVITGQTVARGADDFGYADPTALALLIAQGAPLKVVAAYQQQSAACFIFRPADTIRGPKDLIDKKVIHGAGDNATTLAKAVLGKAGMTFNDLTSVVVPSTNSSQAFLTTKHSVLLANANSTYQTVKAEDPSTKCKLFSSLGSNVLGFSLFTTKSMIAKHPDIVKGVVAASSKAWKGIATKQKAAIDATINLFPDLDRSVEEAQLRATIPLQHTASTEGKPVGWMSEADWEDTISVMRRYGGLKGGPSLSGYYTDEFIPAS